MRRGGWRAASVALILATLACSDPEPTRADLSQLSFDYGFLVILDDTGTPTRVLPPFGYSGHELSFGTLPVVELGPRENSYILVTLERAELEPLGFLAPRARELEARLEAPPDPVRRDPRETGDVLSLPVPETADLYFGEVSRGAVELTLREDVYPRIATSVTLQIPIDAEYCRIPNQSKMEVFGPGEYILQGFTAEEGSVAHFDQLEWLSDGNLLALTWMNILLVKEGEPLTPGPRALRLLETVPTAREGVRTVRFAIDPRTKADPVKRILVVGAALDFDLSKIWEVELRGEELVLVTETSTIGELTDVAILDDGSEWFGARGGKILRRNSGELEPISLDIIQGDVGAPRFLVLNDPVRPLLVTTQTRAHFLDPVTQRFESTTLLQEGAAAGDPIDFVAVAAGRDPSGGLEIWIGGERGAIFRHLNGSWKRMSFVYPPRIFNCGARADSGEFVYTERFTGAALSSDYLHLVMSECNAILQVRRSDQCVSILSRNDEILAPIAQKSKSVAAREGSVVVGTLGGQIYRSDW